jgi:hypothetical protein
MQKYTKIKLAILNKFHHMIAQKELAQVEIEIAEADIQIVLFGDGSQAVHKKVGMIAEVDIQVVQDEDDENKID